MEADSQLQEDVHPLWVHRLKCYTDSDTEDVSDDQLDAVLAYRQRRLELYAKPILVKLDTDPARLAAAGDACRVRREEKTPDADRRERRSDGYLRGAEVAEVALSKVRRARADQRPAARERLLRQADQDTYGAWLAESPLRTRIRTAADNLAVAPEDAAATPLLASATRRPDPTRHSSGIGVRTDGRLDGHRHHQRDPRRSRVIPVLPGMPPRAALQGQCVYAFRRTRPRYSVYRHVRGGRRPSPSHTIINRPVALRVSAGVTTCGGR